MIPLNELVRLQKALRRFEGAFESAYPGSAARMQVNGDDACETARNALTALGYLTGWINYRNRQHRDPEGLLRTETALAQSAAGKGGEG